MTNIGCPGCGQSVEIANGLGAMPEKAACTHCGHEFFISEGMEIGSETAVLEKERPNRGAMLDIALVGHLRVTGSMSLEAPSALRPGKTVVGREDADIVAADTTLSAQHFEIENRDSEFFLRDLGSTNGTMVNGELVTGTIQLQNGNRIEAGKTTFVFRTLETIPWTTPK
jgi:hypothetical protein